MSDNWWEDSQHSTVVACGEEEVDEAKADRQAMREGDAEKGAEVDTLNTSWEHRHLKVETTAAERSLKATRKEGTARMRLRPGNNGEYSMLMSEMSNAPNTVVQRHPFT